MSRQGALIFALCLAVVALAAALGLSLRNAPPAAPAEKFEKAQNFSLLDLDGKYFELQRQGRWTAVVLVTYGVGCPIIEKNLPLLEKMRKAYEAQGVGFFLLDANPQDHPAAIREAVRDLPVLRDREQSVARTFGFTRTSEAILIRTADWAVLYRGAVDDRLTYGADRPAASHFWLRDAIEAHLRRVPVAVPRTQPDGCLLERMAEGPPPTFTGGVGAIFRQRCNSCHVPGRARPTNFVSFEEIKGWAPMIEEVLLTHRMPPWPIDPDYGRFDENLGLAPGEERALLSWIRAGAPRGEGAEPAPPAHAGGPVRRVRADFHITKRSGPIPPSTGSRWVYTPLLESAPRDIWVSAFKVDVGNQPRVHMSLYVVPKLPDLSHTERGLMLEGKEVLYRQNLSPSGRKFLAFPEGVAVKIPKGAGLLLEEHLYPSSVPEVATADVLLEEYRGKARARELRYAIISSRDFEIPAGSADFPLLQTWTVPRDTWVVSVLPHMHLHGVSMKAFVTPPGGKREELFSVPNYSFTHIRQYTFERPVKLAAGSLVTVTAFFDNSAANPYHAPFDRPLRFGPDAEHDEMCDLVLYSFY